jgi:electron transport complex protein RnfC
LLEEPEHVIGGLKVVLSLFPYANGVIAVSDDNTECIALLKEKTTKELRVGVKVLPAKYPQGAEWQIAMALTGRSLDFKESPATIKCIVINTETAAAVYSAVIEGRNLISRIVTISGDAVKEPQNIRVRLGTSYHVLLDEVGGYLEEPEKIVAGGAMRGWVLSDLDLPGTKTTTGLLCFKTDDIAATPPVACINCGKCAEVCPQRLLPSRLATFAEHGEEELFESYCGWECCECGCCSFICPAKRNLTQKIKAMLYSPVEKASDE